MCFYDYEDCDWFAKESTKAVVVSDGTKKYRCFDCREIIPSGEPCVETNQWEHEKCPFCHRRHEETIFTDDDQRCDPDEPDGEHVRLIQCLLCKYFRVAIVDYELNEGCGIHESQPLGSLNDVLRDFDQDGRSPYFAHAFELFPEEEQSLRAKWRELV